MARRKKRGQTLSRKQNRKRNSAHPFRRWGLILLTLLLVGGGVYGLNTWQYLAVSELAITGTDQVSQTEVRTFLEKKMDTKRWGVLRARAIAFMPERRMEQTLSSEFSRIQRVDIQRRPPDTIRVRVTEYEPLLRICPETCYVMSTSGVITHRATERNKTLPRLTGELDRTDVEVGERALTVREARWLATIVSRLKESVDLTVTKIAVQEVFEGQIQRIRVYGETGYYIKIDSKTDVVHQIRTLQTVLENHIPKSKHSELTYVDIRIKNRVYYQ